MSDFVAMLSALGHAARLQVFRLLVRAGAHGCCVDDIRRRVQMPGSTLSHHLDALSRSGLVTARREGRFIYYAVDWEQAAGLIRFLTQDCCSGLDVRTVADGDGTVPQRARHRKAGRSRVSVRPDEVRLQKLGATQRATTTKRRVQS